MHPYRNALTFNTYHGKVILTSGSEGLSIALYALRNPNSIRSLMRLVEKPLLRVGSIRPSSISRETARRFEEALLV